MCCSCCEGYASLFQSKCSTQIRQHIYVYHIYIHSATTKKKKEYRINSHFHIFTLSLPFIQAHSHLFWTEILSFFHLEGVHDDDDDNTEYDMRNCYVDLNKQASNEGEFQVTVEFTLYLNSMSDVIKIFFLFSHPYAAKMN